MGGRLGARLLAAMFAVALVTVAVTGALTFSLTRRDAQRAALTDLRNRAPELARELRATQRALRLRAGRGGGVLAARVLRSTLAASGARVLTVRPDGTVIGGLTGPSGRPLLPTVGEDLPAGLRAAELEPDRLLTGEEVDGQRAGTVFLAVPLGTGPGGTTVLLLTQQVERAPGATTQRLFLGSAAVATLIAAATAALLARRLTRPITAMRETARRLAAGDLTARVPPPGRDRTELGELAGVLDTMAGRLEELQDAQRTFLLSVTHDLRTPLTAIRGFAEAITDGVVPADELPRVAAVIQAEARRLGRLVDDLLALAQLDAHRFRLHPDRGDVAAVVTATVDAFAPQAAGLGVGLHTIAPSELPATFDATRLGQVVANLVENALRHAAGRVDVHLEATATPPGFRITVTDDGPGLDPARRARPFARPGPDSPVPAGRAVGTGLGLAIVAELAAAMGGRAELVHPGPGGTTFAVWFPPGPPPQRAGLSATSTGPAKPSTSSDVPGATSART